MYRIFTIKDAVMRKLSLAVSIAALSVVPSLSLADIFDARSSGRGGAGLTMGEYNQAILNPALINHFDENDDFSFALNVGVFASDKDGMLDATDDAQDALDKLESNSAPSMADVNDANAKLAAMSGKMLQIEAGTSVLIGIPNKRLPAALVVKGKASAGTQFTYDSTDLARLVAIDNGVTCGGSGPVCTQDDLQSQVVASAVGLAEAGLMFGHKLAGGLELGATFKAQQIELYAYSASVGTFDEADIVDSNSKQDHSAFNVDLGASMRLGDKSQYVLAGAIENLVPQSFDGPVRTNGTPNPADDVATEYEMNPVLTAAVGYNNSWLKAEANVDLTERAGYDLLKDTQFARLGLEFSAGRHFHLRAGYRADLKDNVSSVVTGGIGITPWDRFNIDLSGMIGEGETYGAALQIGFKI